MTETIPRDFIDTLLARIDLVDLIHPQVPLKKKSGSNYFARCPFHQEKSASFSVSQTKQFYYCFGCGAHGNAIDFLIQHDRLSFPEAIEALAKQAGLEVPRTTNAPKKDASLQDRYDLMTDVSTYYYDQMRKLPRAIDYLKSRGISGDIAKQFRIGFSPSGWSHLLDTFGKQESDRKKLLEVGLAIKKPEGGYYDRFRDRIMFPIHDYRGRIIGFGGRILDQGEPKYLNSPETPLFQKGHELYGLHQALKTNRHLNRVIVVEGYMDVVALFQHGITYAVATLGTATTTHHFQRLCRYTQEIIFCFDGDNAGRTAAWRALEVIFPLMNDQLQVRFLFLPDGEDPDSLVRKEGKAAFEQRMTAGARSLSDFFFQSVALQSDMTTMEGRAQFASHALKYLQQLPSGIFRNILLEELGQRARIDVSKLNLTAPTPPAPTEQVTRQTQQINMPAPVRLALMLLVQQPSLATKLSAPLGNPNIPGVSLLSQLVDIIGQNTEMTTAILLEHWRDSAEFEMLAILAQAEHMIPPAGMENEFLGSIRQLDTLRMDAEINRLLAKAALQGLSDEEKHELNDCIAQKKHLKRPENAS